MAYFGFGWVGCGLRFLLARVETFCSVSPLYSYKGGSVRMVRKKCLISSAISKKHLGAFVSSDAKVSRLFMYQRGGLSFMTDPLLWER